jgi:hypothetical protein
MLAVHITKGLSCDPTTLTSGNAECWPYNPPEPEFLASRRFAQFVEK